MSNSNSGKQKTRLIAEADEGTEIFVIDGSFRRVTSALKRMETDLSPGLYTVKFKRGGALVEVDADLLPGSGPVLVKAPMLKLAFASAAPMDQTITSHEYHQEAAARMSRTDPMPIDRGRGARLFLFVRDIGVDGIGNPAEKVTLHDPKGRQVIDFGSFGEIGHEQDTSAAAWYGCNFELAPGFYRLRVTDRSGMPSIEQSLILVKDWQLQVFLVRDRRQTAVSPRTSGQTHASEATVDLAAGSIFMARPDRGFDPWDPSGRLTELARQGLKSGRIPVTEEDFRKMLAGKFENPMLGLFGAHLLIPLVAKESSLPLLRPSDPEILRRNRAIQLVLGITADGIVGPRTRQKLHELLEEVIGNLDSMLGNHPDVRAIRNELGYGNTAARKERNSPPPMLQRSWEILVGSDPEYILAMAGSFLERIADRTWGTGPWFVWQVPPAVSRRKSFDYGRFRQLALHIGDTVAEPGKIEHALGEAGLNPVEESLVINSLKQAGLFSSRRAAAIVPPVEKETSSSLETTARFLGIPVMTLERNLASAMAKIDNAVESKKDSLQNLAKAIRKPERR